MTKQLKMSALVVAMLVSANAFATKPGYTVDQTTDAVTRNSYGECWKTTFFNKATQGLVECGDKVEVAPVVVAPVLVPTKEKVSLAAEVLFDFGSHHLRASAKEELDPLVAKLKAQGANLTAVLVEGFTDYVGSEASNMKLSAARAHAVSEYLVANGIDSAKVTTAGKGETEAKMTAECSSKKPVSARNACLQPDRKVDLTIDAMKEVLPQ